MSKEIGLTDAQQHWLNQQILSDDAKELLISLLIWSNAARHLSVTDPAEAEVNATYQLGKRAL